MRSALRNKIDDRHDEILRTVEKSDRKLPGASDHDLQVIQESVGVKFDDDLCDLCAVRMAVLPCSDE